MKRATVSVVVAKKTKMGRPEKGAESRTIISKTPHERLTGTVEGRLWLADRPEIVEALETANAIVGVVTTSRDLLCEKALDLSRRANILRRLSRMKRAMLDHNPDSIEDRRGVLRHALDAAVSVRASEIPPEFARSAQVTIARTVISNFWNHAVATAIDEATLWQAIDAYAHPPRSMPSALRWGAIKKLADAVGCGAENAEQFRTQFTRIHL